MATWTEHNFVSGSASEIKKKIEEATFTSKYNFLRACSHLYLWPFNITSSVAVPLFILSKNGLSR